MLGTDDVCGLSWHLIHPLVIKGKLTIEKSHYLMAKQDLFPYEFLHKTNFISHQTVTPWSHLPF
jgi:hypothetical protein